MSRPRSRIRTATDDDIDGLLDLERRCFTSRAYRYHRFGERQFRYYLHNPNALVLLQEIAGEPVAYILGIFGTGVRVQIARIHSLAVRSDARRKGVAGKLLRKFVQRCRLRGIGSVMLEVAEGNGAALALFRREGFRVQRRLPGYYGRGMDGLRMRRTLDRAS